MRSRGFVVVGSALAFALLCAGSALGQVQTKDQQKCINTLNKDTGKVAATQGKENSGCVKAGNKGTATAGCLTADAKGKVLKKKTKTTDDETKNGCLGANAPSYAYSSGVAGNTAAQNQEINLFEDTYGTTTLPGPISTAKLEGGCQAAVTKGVEAIIATKFKQYIGCKKNVLKNGGSTAAAVAACIDSAPESIATDPKGKIAKKQAKLGADITKKCTGVTVATTFPGDCSGATLGTLGTCLDQRAECRVCLMINAIDSIGVDCDLFDDGLSNGSCGVAFHKCNLDTAPASDSQIRLHIAALPVPLTFGISGALDIGADPDNNDAACKVQMLNPISIPSIGLVCVTPGGSCPNGTRFCGPGAGPALGVDVQSDGNAGACTSQAACESICAASCAPNAVGTAGCTGFCSGGSNPACTSDAACLPSNGACNGPDPLMPALANICQCSCINTSAHGASTAGTFQCNLSSDLNVESAAPCNGTDVTISVGSTCIPVTTQRATGLITDSNFSPGSTVPAPPNVNDQTGVGLACATVDTSTVTGIRGVGAVNFFGSALGDLSVELKSTCL